MKLQHLPIPLVAIAAAILIACSGGAAESTPTPSPTPTPDPVEVALAALTIENLEPLVLSVDDFGPLATELVLGEDSGSLDNDAAAEDFASLGKTGADLGLLGRLGGHEVTLETFEFEAGQVVQLNSWVELFDPDADIPGYLALNIEALQATSGNGEVEIVGLTEFDIPSVEHSNGWDILARYEGLDEPVRFATATVQVGRLLGGVQVVVYGDADPTEATVDLLERLDRHIEDTLTAEAAPAS